MYVEHFSQCLAYVLSHKWKLVVFSFPDILATILTFCILSCIFEGSRNIKRDEENKTDWKTAFGFLD